LGKQKKSKNKTALLWDLSGAFVKQFASLFISILLARLLGPNKFGIIAMAMVVVNISSVVTDVGFSNALIQQQKTKHIAFSSVFYMNTGIALIISCIILLIRPYVAIYFEEPKLQAIMCYLAVIPPISAAGSVQSAILTKKIDFKTLTLKDMLATTIGGLLGVIAAFSGFGVYSLVLQHIAMVVIGTSMLWYFTKWRPKWEFSILEIRKLFSYSSYLFLDNLIRRIFINIDTIFIGKAFSPLTLGVYNRAQSLKSQVDNYTTKSLSKVIFPVLTNLQYNDKTFRKTYHRAFNILGGLIILLIAPLYFLANIIIINLLGEEWFDSILLFEIIILATIVRPHVRIMGKALLAKGYSKFKFKIGLIQRGLMLLPISIGYFYGINYFAGTVVISYYIVFLLYLIALEKKMNISFWKQLKNVILPNLMFVVFLILDFFYGINLNRWLMTGAFLVMHLAYMRLINHESYSFLVNTIRSLVQRGES